MKILSRAYDEKCNDFKKLWDFLIECNRESFENCQWSIGRLSDWKYGLWHEKKLDPEFFASNCQLFTNMFDELVGVAIAEDGDSLFHLFAKKNFEQYLYPKMLNFVEKNWGKEDGIRTEVSEDDVILNELYLKAGYKKKAESQTTIYAIPTFERKQELAPGYKIVNLEDNRDYESKKLLYMDGFDGRFDTKPWDEVIHSYNRQGPAYNPRYDFSVVDISGDHISGCVCFIDFENNYAEIEKVCTKGDHRRKGLATSVIQHAIGQLKDIGIEYAMITGYSTEAKGAYLKVGPSKVVVNYKYSKVL